MYQTLKNLNANQQIAALFVTVFGFLLLAIVVTLLLSLREHDDDETVSFHSVQWYFNL